MIVKTFSITGFIQRIRKRTTQETIWKRYLHISVRHMMQVFRLITWLFIGTAYRNMKTELLLWEIMMVWIIRNQRKALIRWKRNVMRWHDDYLTEQMIKEYLHHVSYWNMQIPFSNRLLCSSVLCPLYNVIWMVIWQCMCIRLVYLRLVALLHY